MTAKLHGFLYSIERGDEWSNTFWWTYIGVQGLGGETEGKETTGET